MLQESNENHLPGGGASEVGSFGATATSKTKGRISLNDVVSNTANAGKPLVLLDNGKASGHRKEVAAATLAAAAATDFDGTLTTRRLEALPFHGSTIDWTSRNMVGAV